MKNSNYRNILTSSFRTGIALLAIAATVIPLRADTASTVKPPAMTKQNNPGAITAEQIRKQLASLSSYGVFDDLSFQLNGSAVTLNGYASRPILKSDAERVVLSVEGVQSVVNSIEVLPLSPMDDNIRLKTYLAIYRNPSLQRYSTGSGFMPRLTPLWAAGGITNNPPMGWNPIHIIVKNGNVTLTGIVDRGADKTIAGMAANRVRGVFGVTNGLTVARNDAKHDNTNKAVS